jgi:hypothetical protein
MAEPKRAWTDAELHTLERLAHQGYSSTVAALRLGRSLAAVQQKAAAAGISFNNGRAGRRAVSGV